MAPTNFQKEQTMNLVSRAVLAVAVGLGAMYLYTEYSEQSAKYIFALVLGGLILGLFTRRPS